VQFLVKLGDLVGWWQKVVHAERKKAGSMG